MYREVFHPAVVPPPPFIKFFLFLVHNNEKRCVCHSCSNKCFKGLRFQGLSCWVSVFIESQVLEFRFLAHRIFGSWVYLVVSFFWVIKVILGSGSRAWIFGSQFLLNFRS